MEKKSKHNNVVRLAGLSALTVVLLNGCGVMDGPAETASTPSSQPSSETASTAASSDARTIADLQARFSALQAQIDPEAEAALPVEKVAALINTARSRSEQASRPGSPRFEMAATEAEAGLQALQRDWAALQAERARLAREEQAAAERAEQARLAEERAAAERLEEQMRERREAERLAAEQAEQERRAAERAEQERIAAEQAEQAEQERLAAEQAEQERMAAEQAEQERMAAERAEQERLAAEQAAQERQQAEQAAEQAAADQKAANASMAVDPVDIDFTEDGAMELDKIPPASAAEAARLGQDLTPVGAPRAGNEDGTIPAWTGGITSPPAGYTPGEHHIDPFPGDQIAFTITADNYQNYADNLSAGQIAMFERYPTYRLPVYQTRRTASFPQRIYDATRQNATTGRLTFNGEGVTDVAQGFPFPFPRNAYHLMWNHKLKYKGWSVERWNNQIAPTASGAYSVTRIREELLAPYFRPGNSLADIENILGYFFQIVEGPARLAGNILLVHETLNQVDQERQAWVYNPGQRRVRRAPNVAYDNPGTASDGLTTNDMLDMFNGALDRYTWHLLGKREMYVPYNAYKAHSSDLEYEELIEPGHLNPDYLRYELHRVWVVEARLKDGVRHIHPRRTFYLDEDSYQILLTDHYDARGDLWRHSEAHAINYYDQPVLWSTLEVHHDLSSGRYIATGLDNQEAMYQFNVELNPNDYTPAALRQRGRR